MLLASGEQIQHPLLAMALNEIGCHATSLTGWQAGSARIDAYTKAVSLVWRPSGSPPSWSATVWWW